MGVDQTVSAVPEDAVGRRVSCGGERATVRYVGPVPPTTGLWLGVEWDNPDRGKHDGSHEGVQYFTCRHTKGGSFVRPAKVSFGVDYLTAVRQVYQINTEEVLSEEMSVNWKDIKERSFESLPSVLLGRREVNSPGDSGEIRKTTPNVQWLDLSRTLLSCWEDVAAITEQLDKLEGLQLSYNRLCLPSDPSAHCQAFCSLKVLALNSCDLTWPQILECAPMWPQLEDLSVDENNITELQRPEGVLQSVKLLSLSCNPLLQDSVLNMSALPRLEQLNLSKTGLSVIRFDDAAPGSQTAMFPALKNLSLDQNNITEWRVVDELAKLRSLVQLSCRGNRLVSSDGNPKTANQMLIAKLGRLVVLNGCKIPSEDRRGAELDYIKMFGEEWLKAGGRSQPSAQFTCQHPRYQSLIHKYGAPEEGELKKPEPFALKNQLLKITFVFPDDADRKPIEKKLPATMVVQKVKGLLYRLLKVPAADLMLTYTSPKMVGTEFEIDSDLKTLQFYSIEDGDQVLVRWS
ncbi:tubulin-specific chaperone E [Xiphias gladius]|uniref:tubulin-specific chaperone E n=1 Tax=Xiphias gladius TaxID=8245 RepID=UPI001A98F862|nr:tubulin-specific chaperone E [Xiphias gladius]XP_040001106.1 tubulin-specific chaperone E [Xiphias gladius]XP_040001107.1 tubulin-specific chaperone E [Xiphias gladius]